MKNIYQIRTLGRDYCQTEGSAHYKDGGVEPLDLMYAKGIIEDFCIGNVIKYVTRFKVTRNLDDLKKVSDYAHILAGVEMVYLEKNHREALSRGPLTEEKAKELIKNGEKDVKEKIHEQF